MFGWKYFAARVIDPAGRLLLGSRSEILLERREEDRTSRFRAPEVRLSRPAASYDFRRLKKQFRR